MATILVVSPDLRALQAARQALAQRGYVVVYEYSGAGGLSALDTVQVDVICFDRAVQDISPAEFSNQIRSSANLRRVPMIFLLKSSSPSTRAPSYVRQGVDTYLTRPFRPAELVERISAMLDDRVSDIAHQGEKVLRAGPIVLDDESQTLEVEGREVEVTPIEFRLIWHLTERAGTPVPSENLLIEVWGFPRGMGDAALVRAHVSHIRKKLTQAGLDPGFLQTVSRRGYRIVIPKGGTSPSIGSAHRILITGATGIIGRHLVAALLDAGRRPIRCLVKDSDDVQVLEGQGLELAFGDMAKGRGLAEVVAGVRTIINLAVGLRPQGLETYEAVNQEGVRRLMEAAGAAGVRRVIHLGEQGELDEPQYPYLRSRYGGRQAVIESGIPYTIIRPGIVFGPEDHSSDDLALLSRNGTATLVGGRSDLKLQPIHVEDLAQCVIAVIEDPRFENQVLDLGGPEHITLQEVVDAIKPRPGRRGSLPLLSGAARSVAFLRKHLPIRRGQPPASLEQLAHDSVTDLDVVPRLFGFQPRGLQDSIDHLDQDPPPAAS